jgi:hypothetical protein
MDRIEIMRDDTLIRTFYGRDNQVREFSDETGVEATETPHAYYVKVFQTDGGCAWSSPTWITSPAYASSLKIVIESLL